MKIAFMCDMHLPENNTCVQYDYFTEAVEEIKKSDAEMTVVLGDIAAFGEKSSLDFFAGAMHGISYIAVLGNSDVRQGDIDKSAFGGSFKVGSKTVLCINTPHAEISDSDKKSISCLSSGDILVMHHSIPSLDEASRVFLTDILNKKSLTVIHAHSHNFQDYNLGKSRVICLRALDPDKSIGGPPCITYFDINESEFSFSEKCFTTNSEKIADFRDYLGISCFDVTTDIDFAIENSVKNLELRKYKDGDGLLDFTLEKIKTWRKSGGRTLSVHMPNIRFSDGLITAGGWEYAKKLALALGADSLTIHVPRISVGDMKTEFKQLVDFYAEKLSEFPENIKVGIENLHSEKNEQADDSRGFGYTPDEVLSFVSAINKILGENRVGVTLDVGHARNNPPYNSKYPLGMWYASVGKSAVCYHIHQVSRENGVLKNHTEIKSLFGPMISYSSFFRSWATGEINKCPAFLEIRDKDERQRSVFVFDKMTLI